MSGKIWRREPWGICIPPPRWNLCLLAIPEPRCEEDEGESNEVIYIMYVRIYRLKYRLLPEAS